jgi:hypothetical protein
MVEVFEDIEPPKKLKKEGGGRLNKPGSQAAAVTKPLKPEETINFDDKAQKQTKSFKKPPVEHLIRLKTWWKGLNRNVRFGIISAALLLFGAAAIGYFFLISPKGEPVLEVAKPKPKTTVASPLTGVEVAPELAARPVTAIMIENSTEARPQSGLMDAGVIFEAIAEGGITRFITLYQEGQPQYIGPVRSLRPYYIDWATTFDAPIAHVGGSPDALAQIRSGGKDLDQFFNPGAYWRQPTRASPHNVYTSFERLDALNKAKGFSTSKFTPWLRKSDTPQPVPAAKGININISSGNYNSRYDYDAASNAYLRSQAGRPHIITSSPTDAAGQQLRPKTIIVLILAYSLNGKYSVYVTSGSGPALIFQDGGVSDATWTKSDRASQFKFTDAAGKEVRFNSGQTWIVAVASRDKVTYEAAPPPPPPPPQ